MKSGLLVLSGLMVVLAMTTGVTTRAQQAAGTTPTFNKDVAPIIFNNCVSCHRPNQIAPMSLMSYQEIRPWARAIKDKVIKRQMPPWFADGRFGEFRNDRRLSTAQVDTIVAWVDGGAPQGDTPLTAEIPSTKDGWSHPSGRPPDFVIEMANPFQVPAQGELPNFTFYEELPPELKREDHFLEAIQILPGVIPAVHHASFGVGPLPPGTRIGSGAAWPGGPVLPGALINIKTGKPVADLVGDVNEAAGGEEGANGQRPAPTALRFCCYVPGGSFQQFRPGVGRRILKDGYIAWGTHYTPVGKPVTDRTRVGLWFQQDLRYEIVGTNNNAEAHIVLGKELINDEFTPVRTRSVVGNTGFPALPVIPPHAKNWAITEMRVFQDDATAYVLWPHMHNRGKEMTYLLTYPDGREQVLLSVPNYDFNWQLFYELKEPLKIPAGSTLKVIGSYDNSPANRWNPAPQKEVYWSEQSWDEMYAGFMDVSIDKRDLLLKKTPAKLPTAGGR